MQWGNIVTLFLSSGLCHVFSLQWFVSRVFSPVVGVTCFLSSGWCHVFPLQWLASGITTPLMAGHGSEVFKDLNFQR